MAGPPTVPGRELNPGPLSFEASALLTELTRPVSHTPAKIICIVSHTPVRIPCMVSHSCQNPVYGQSRLMSESLVWSATPARIPCMVSHTPVRIPCMVSYSCHNPFYGQSYSCHNPFYGQLPESHHQSAIPPSESQGVYGPPGFTMPKKVFSMKALKGDIR